MADVSRVFVLAHTVPYLTENSGLRASTNTSGATIAGQALRNVPRALTTNHGLLRHGLVCLSSRRR